jgi:hypothetical protein
MEIDDLFDTDALDVFGSDVEALVLSSYKAAIDGIGRLDEKERSRLHEYDLDVHPEVQQEIDWWDKHVEALKYHAGNIGLASLVLLFDDWLEKRERDLLPPVKRPRGRESRFQELEKQLGKGPLSLQRLCEIVDARDSIMHHRGKSRFTWKKRTREVIDEFINEVSGELRVAIEELVLFDVTKQVTSQADFWFRTMREKDKRLRSSFRTAMRRNLE